MTQSAPEMTGRTRTSCFLILLLLGSAVLALPGVANASQCFYPYVPRPLESSQEIREQLEADGLWHPTRTPPVNPQVGDTWDWYIWDLSGYPTATLKPCTVRGMGANSYIGNGPNFMVRSIAEERGVRMPSFGGYMLYSGAVLLPVFGLVTLVFFR